MPSRFSSSTLAPSGRRGPPSTGDQIVPRGPLDEAARDRDLVEAERGPDPVLLAGRDFAVGGHEPEESEPGSAVISAVGRALGGRPGPGENHEVPFVQLHEVVGQPVGCADDDPPHRPRVRPSRRRGWPAAETLPEPVARIHGCHDGDRGLRIGQGDLGDRPGRGPRRRGRRSGSGRGPSHAPGPASACRRPLPAHPRRGGQGRWRLRRPA